MGMFACYLKGWTLEQLSAKFWMICSIMDWISGTDPGPDWPLEFRSLHHIPLSLTLSQTLPNADPSSPLLLHSSPKSPPFLHHFPFSSLVTFSPSRVHRKSSRWRISKQGKDSSHHLQDSS